MLLEICWVLKHIFDDIAGEPVLLIGTYTASDDPENLSDGFLIIRHRTILGKPHWERHFQVKEARSVRQGDIVVLPLGLCA